MHYDDIDQYVDRFYREQDPSTSPSTSSGSAQGEKEKEVEGCAASAFWVALFVFTAIVAVVIGAVLLKGMGWLMQLGLI